MKTQQTPIVRPIENYVHLKDVDVSNVCANVVTGMTLSSTIFLIPPVPLAAQPYSATRSSLPS